MNIIDLAESIITLENTIKKYNNKKELNTSELEFVCDTLKKMILKLEHTQKLTQDIAKSKPVKIDEEKVVFSKEFTGIMKVLDDTKVSLLKVASGDYEEDIPQHGELSKCIAMVRDSVAQRENNMSMAHDLMFKTYESMKSLMGAVKDWILVFDAEDGQAMYANESAKGFFYNPETDSHVCGDNCDLLDYLREYGKENRDQYVYYNYSCKRNERYMTVASFLISWNNRPAYAHYIEDVTDEIKYKESIEEIAYRDPLTNLFNRRYSVSAIDKFMSVGEKFILCLIDLDGLKFVNDTYGHGEGDKYLQTLSEALQSRSRSSDVIGRMGGDEFLVLFPKCPEQIAIDKMQKANEEIVQKATIYPMSMSFGIVEVDSETTLDAEELIKLADERMYEQKKAKKAQRK